MPVGANNLTQVYGADMERAIRMTVPGMADFCDPNSPEICGHCLHFSKKGINRGFCKLFKKMTTRHKGIMFNAGQRACRRWEQGKV